MILMISIKKVTKLTGITVRTMRYYDQIGLLPPADKTEGGHRLYGEEDIKKLQEIQFLKTLGFSLKEIKEILSEGNHDWSVGLQNQLAYISKEIEKMKEIESTLNGLLNQFTLEEKIDLFNIQRLIHLFQQNSDKRETYRNQIFNHDEKKLLAKLPNINRDDPDTLEWVSLLDQLKKHMHRGISSAEIQRIIKRIFEKEKEAFGDNEEFLLKLWEVRKSPEKSEKAGFYQIEQEILDFIEKASEFYLNQESHHSGSGDNE